MGSYLKSDWSVYIIGVWSDRRKFFGIAIPTKSATRVPADFPEETDRWPNWRIDHILETCKKEVLTY